MPTKTENWTWFEQGYNRTKAVSTLTGATLSDVITPNSTLRQIAVNVVSGTNPGWRHRLKTEPVLVGDLHATISKIGSTGPLTSVRAVTEISSKVRRTVEDNPFGASADSVSGLDPSLVTQASAKATAKLLKKYHKNTQALQGLVFLGEIRETMALVLRPAKGIHNLLQQYLRTVTPSVAHYKRGGLSLSKVTSRLSDEWLQYSFGLAPLINDANNVANFYNHWNEPKVGFIPIVAVAGAESASPPSVRRQSFPDGWFLQYTSLVGQQVTVKLRTAIRATAGPGAIASALGTSWRDFAPAVWELLPWSFFIDYFTNVGDIIDAWSYAGVFTEGIQQTVIRDRKSRLEGWNWDFHPVSPQLYSGPASSIADVSVYQRAKQIDRTKLSSLPIPPIQVSTGLSPTRWANILALSRNNTPVYQRR